VRLERRERDFGDNRRGDLLFANKKAAQDRCSAGRAVVGWIIVAERLQEIVVGEMFGSSVVGTRNGADRRVFLGYSDCRALF
jgi:hypothetical protein